MGKSCAEGLEFTIWNAHGAQEEDFSTVTLY